MRAALVLSLALAGCAPVLRPLTATDAATDLDQVTRTQGNEYDPAISPDGKEVAYDAGAAGGARHVEVMDLAKRTIVFSSNGTPGDDPAWLPDASSIVFSSTSGGRRRLLETFGQGVRPVFLGDVGDPAFGGGHPAVSPDGKLVVLNVDRVWSAGRAWNHALGVTDLLGTGLEVIGRGRDPAVSPDGRKLAFAARAGGHDHLFVSNVDGSDPVQITFGADDDESPAFSPDGQSIVFCSKDGEPPLLRSNLFVVAADGSNLVQLTEGDRLACHPSWGRDGFVYFHANARRRFHVFRVRPRTSEAS